MIVGFPGGAVGKEVACRCRTPKRQEFDPWVGKIPWRRKWQLTPVFLPGGSHGQRVLVGCSPQGHEESNMTEHTTQQLIYSVVLVSGVQQSDSKMSRLLVGNNDCWYVQCNILAVRKEGQDARLLACDILPVHRSPGTLPWLKFLLH